MCRRSLRPTPSRGTRRFIGTAATLALLLLGGAPALALNDVPSGDRAVSDPSVPVLAEEQPLAESPDAENPAAQPPGITDGPPADFRDERPGAEPLLNPENPEPPAELELAGALLVVPGEHSLMTLVEDEHWSDHDDHGIAAGVSIATGGGSIVRVGSFANGESPAGIPALDGVELASGQRVTVTVKVPDEVQAAVADRVTGEALVLDRAAAAELVAAQAAELSAELPVADAAFDAPETAAAAAASHSADVMIYNHSGAADRAPTGTEAAAAVGRLSTYWKNNSGGRISALTVNTSVRSQTVSWDVCDENLAWTQAAQAFEQSPTAYLGETGRHLIVLVSRQGCPTTHTGLGSIGQGVSSGGVIHARVPTDQDATTWDQVLAHEFGHNISLGHSNVRECSGSSSDSARSSSSGALADITCSDLEYWDLYDVMGLEFRVTTASGALAISGANLAELNVSQKAKIGALGADLRQVSLSESDYVQAVTLNGSGEGVGLRGLQIIAPPDRRVSLRRVPIRNSPRYEQSLREVETHSQHRQLSGGRP